MKIGITPLIAENIAPPNAEKFAIFNGNTKICDVDISKMKPTNLGEKLYSFGLVSDIHLYKDDVSWVDWNPNVKFDNALSYFENEGCAFCVVCGDLTQTGLYSRTVETDASTTYLDEAQFAKYKEICDKHSITVYELMGNHESYYVAINNANDLSKMNTYTGNTDLYYKIEYQNDFFILCGQPSATIPMSDEAFTFLSQTLSANKNKRCFVFVHPVWNDDSGDANGVYTNNSGLGGTLLSYWERGTDLKNLLKQYPKVVLFHGHTHIKFEEQVKDKSLNYTKKNGFHSVHIPSLGRPRNIIDNNLIYKPSDSEGYIVDVYKNHIILKGYDFEFDNFIPIAQYCVDTTT